MKQKIFILITIFTVFIGTIAQTKAEPSGGLTPRAYLPIVIGADCPTSSANVYSSGSANQYDNDNPVRPAYDHADKNIELRGYIANSDPDLKRELVNYGSGDKIQPPQFATLFDPYQVPTFADFYQVHNWNWAFHPQ